MAANTHVDLPIEGSNRFTETHGLSRRTKITLGIVAAALGVLIGIPCLLALVTWFHIQSVGAGATGPSWDLIGTEIQSMSFPRWVFNGIDFFFKGYAWR